MKTNNLRAKVLWFVLGFVLAGSIMFILPTRGQPTQDIYQRMASLEARVKSIETELRAPKRKEPDPR